tara:strand:- start:634 stop:1770 length:1137 start_codon:yes stop_codon:yes gene_type:complete
MNETQQILDAEPLEPGTNDIKCSSCVLSLSSNDLPALSSTDSERHHSWVIVAASPGFMYEGEMHAVDEKWIAAQVNEFNRLTDRGYTPPVLAEHTRNGGRLGDIVRLKQWHDKSDGRLKLLAEIKWAIDAKPMIESGELKYVSAGFAQITDERGRVFNKPYALAEISIVSAPHQKSIGARHILNHETGGNTVSQQDILEDNKAAPDLMSALDELAATVAALGARIATLEEYKAPAQEEAAEDEEEAAEDEEEAAEMSEIAALKEQIAALTLERARDSFAFEHKELLIGMSENERGEVFNAYQQAPGGFAALVARIKAAPAVESQIAHDKTWAARLGEAVDADTTPANKEDLYAQAKQEAQGDPRKALDIYKKLVSNLH